MNELNIYKIVVNTAGEGGVIYKVAAYSLEGAISKLRDNRVYGDINSTELLLDEVIV